MIQITADISDSNYLIELKSASGNLIIADEPIYNGGEDRGLSPKELLVSALASCTLATLKMYIQKKEWNIPTIHIVVSMDEKEGKTIFNRSISFDDQLEEDKIKVLLKVANACPIHKILTHESDVNTQIQH